MARLKWTPLKMDNTRYRVPGLYLHCSWDRKHCFRTHCLRAERGKAGGGGLWRGDRSKGERGVSVKSAQTP